MGQYRPRHPGSRRCNLSLLVLKYTQLEALCVGNHGCITVNNSIYSEIYGIPVSVFGIVAYLAIAGILLLEPRLKLAKENGPLAVFGISLAGVAFYGLPDLARVLRYSRRLPVLRGLGNYHHLDIHSSHYPARQTNC